MATAPSPVPLVSTHTHTDLSLCGRPDATFDAVVATTGELGYALVVLTDHIHAPTITNYPRHLERLRQYKEKRAALDTSVRILVGGEFEVGAPGRIIATDEFIEACECAIVSPNHYHLDWIVAPCGSIAEMAAHELDAIETILDWPHADIVAHPFACSGLDPTPDDLYTACDKGRLHELFARAQEREIAFEIQPKFWYDLWCTERLAEFFETWLDMGGQIALGSDAHALASLTRWAEKYREIVERFQLTTDRLWWPRGEEH